MNKTWQLRALSLYLTLGVPLAASCARESDTLEPDYPSPSMGGSTTSSAGQSTTSAGTLPNAGTTTSTAGTTGNNAFGGSVSTGGNGTAGTAVAQAGSGGAASGGKAGAGGASGGMSGAGGTTGVPPEVLARAEAVVYYQTSQAAAMTTMIKMTLFIENKAADALPMANVKIRYWLTAEGTTALHQYYTGMQAKMPNAAFVSDGANSHVLMTFGGGSIVKGGDRNQSEIQLEIDSTSTPFNQDNDHSFMRAAATAMPNGDITMYLQDKLIWGCEPSGKCFDAAGGTSAGGTGGTASAGGTGGT